MQLCDKDIYKALKNGELIFWGTNNSYPFLPQKQVQPASVDLRLGNRFVRFIDNINSFDIKDIKRIDDYLSEIFLEDEQGYTIQPNEIVYCHVYEQMYIGDRFSARIEGRSRVARLGLSVHCTGDYINPGFMGSMPLQIINHNRFPITIYPYISVCQIILYKLTDKPLISYAEKSTLPWNRYYNENYPSSSILSSNPGEGVGGGIMENRINTLVATYYSNLAFHGINSNLTNTAERDSEADAIVTNYIQNIYAMEVAMRDQYNAKQAGAQGVNAGQKAIIHQNYYETQNIDYGALVQEIAIIKKHLKDGDDSDDSDIMIGELTKMSNAAEKKDETKITVILKMCGKQICDLAKKVGCTLLASYISGQIGL